MTKDEIKNYVIEHKECCKKLAEEYRQRYNEDNTDKLALNMFYHNVIAYNDFETILATIENRNSMIMCFSEPPILSEKTVEVELNRIEELEQQIEKMKNWCNCKNYQQCLIELAEQGKGMKPSECCRNCKKWEIKENDIDSQK